MSYILDALKKAAEQRGANATVLLRPSVPLVRAVRFRRLPWIVAGGLLVLNLAALVYLVWPARELPAAPQATSSPGTIALIQPIEPSPPAPTQVIPAEPPKPLAPVKPGTPPRAPAAGSRAAATAPTVAATAPAPAVTAPAPAAIAPAPAATAPPARAGAPAVSVPAVPGASAGAGAAPADKPLVRVTPDARVTIARPDPKAAPADPKAGAPAKADGRFKLEVLSYSEIPAQRLVFINGRRYREGEVMDSGVKVEEIREDSVILNEAGQRFTLR